MPFVGVHERLKIHHLPPLPLKLGANLSEGLSELVRAFEDLHLVALEIFVIGDFLLLLVIAST